MCFGIDFKRAKKYSLCVIASSLIYAKIMHEYLKYPLFIMTVKWFAMELGFQ